MKPEQFRVEEAIDRLNTTAAVWLGLTVGCAQCHSHKFDPITQQEFYRMFAFFNQGEDVNSKGATHGSRAWRSLRPAEADQREEQQSPKPCRSARSTRPQWERKELSTDA